MQPFRHINKENIKMIINGKEYHLPKLSFNTMCRLEEMGVSLTELNKMPMATIRAFAALAIGSIDKAGEELEKHLISGGELTDILDEIKTAVNESGFFQALGRKNKNQKNQPRA